MRLRFLGANGQVTGSRYLLEAADQRILIDCGMFQERRYQGRNWQTPLVKPGSVDWLLLTHAHLDHCGLIPRLVDHGFDRPIITTAPSVDLAKIIMADSARIQEEDAAYKQKRHKKEKRKGTYPAVPLYGREAAERAAKLFKPVRYSEPMGLGEHVTVTFHEAGHILGAAIVEIEVRENGIKRRVIFSGDIGQWDKPLVGDPTLLKACDYVVMESTYGDRNHPAGDDAQTQLAKAINQAVHRGGNVIVPTFAVERAQELIYHLGRLVHERRIPQVRVFLDSPMAVDVTDVFRRHRQYLDDKTQALIDARQPPLRFPGLTMSRSVDESKAINSVSGSKVILSTSGMCTAGRIKHHLRANIERPESTILFVGYQGRGTLGRQIMARRGKVRIHGRYFSVRAKVSQLCGFSAHGDRDDLLRWLGHFDDVPRQVFLAHGEKEAAASLMNSVQSQLGWSVSVPQFKQVVTLA